MAKNKQPATLAPLAHQPSGGAIFGRRLKGVAAEQQRAPKKKGEEK